VLVCNIGMFVLVLRSIMVQTKAMESDKRVLLNASLSFFVLLGLAWILAFFVITTHQPVFDYLFAICNTLQGVLLFWFHCLNKPDVRQVYRRILCCGSGAQETSHSSSHSKSKLKSKTPATKKTYLSDFTSHDNGQSSSQEHSKTGTSYSQGGGDYNTAGDGSDRHNSFMAPRPRVFSDAHADQLGDDTADTGEDAAVHGQAHSGSIPLQPMSDDGHNQSASSGAVTDTNAEGLGHLSAPQRNSESHM
jgi:hypothetical protein